MLMMNTCWALGSAQRLSVVAQTKGGESRRHQAEANDFIPINKK